MLPACSPAMNESRTDTSRAGESWAIATAAPTESLPCATADAGSEPKAPVVRCAAYTLEKYDPTTATPRVPPSSRVASLTADPTPARAGGRTSRIDSVAGVEIAPMPRPMRTIWGTITVPYAASTPTVEIHRNAVPKRSRPVVTTALVPIRGASRAPRTEATAMLRATGRVRVPADSVE